MQNKNHRVKPALLPVFAFAVVLATALVFQPATAQEGSNALEAVEVAALPGNQVQLRLRMSDTAPQPETFSTENPARIAIDLPNTRWAADSRRTEIGIGSVRNVMAAESQGKVRLVVNLSDMVEYSTRADGNSVFVTLGGGSASAPVVAVSPDVATPVADKPREPAPPSGKEGEVPRSRAIEGIDFRRGESGEGRVVVALSDPRTVVDLKQEGDQIVLEFKDVQLPESLAQRYDVTDFATPVSTIDAMRRGRDARVVVRTSGKYEQLAYQADNQFTLEINEVKEEATPEEQREKEYTGERLTLNFQDLEVRAFFSIIADLTGLNVVVSDSVSGNITLRLQNVPWDQAVDIVLRTKGLDMRENGNVILVAPAEEIAEMERIELAARQQAQELEPLRSEFIQINYAKASDLAALIQSGQNSLLSDRGSITIDARTNTLLIRDTDTSLANIRRLIQVLDIPVKQVLIESRIVIANDNFNRELGARLGYSQYYFDDGRRYVTSGTQSANTELNNSLSDALAGNSNTVTFPDDRLNVNLPVGNPAGSFALSILGSGYLVDLELSALQAEGQGEVVSAPRIVTANQKQASIRQGVEIPYQESSASGATTTQFKEAVLQLTVTPQITPDERIIMDLIVNKDSVGQQVPSATGGFVPSIDTREITTQVLVNNGDTVVLGGIYETTRETTASKVPLLGDIPGLGLLFRSTQNRSDKRELLIFVTPKILDDRLITE